MSKITQFDKNQHCINLFSRKAVEGQKTTKKCMNKYKPNEKKSSNFGT